MTAHFSTLSSSTTWRLICSKMPWPLRIAAEHAGDALQRLGAGVLALGSKPMIFLWSSVPPFKYQTSPPLKREIIQYQISNIKHQPPKEGDCQGQALRAAGLALATQTAGLAPLQTADLSAGPGLSTSVRGSACRLPTTLSIVNSSASRWAEERPTPGQDPLDGVPPQEAAGVPPPRLLPPMPVYIRDAGATILVRRSLALAAFPAQAPPSSTVAAPP